MRDRFRAATSARRVRRYAAAVLLLAVAGCSHEPPPNPYPDDLVQNFLTGCKRRANASICACALDRIQHRWTADEFRQLDQTLGDAAAAQIAETVASCAGH